MSPLESLVARIRGEYREMPGLRLTFAQACRLWQVDASTCEAVLHTLLKEVRRAIGVGPAFHANQHGNGARPRDSFALAPFRVMSSVAANVSRIRVQVPWSATLSETCRLSCWSNLCRTTARCTLSICASRGFSRLK
jgi:hypothetical protein